MSHPPIAVLTTSACDFLSYCISRTNTRQRNSFSASENNAKDTIMICSTRDAFIKQLLTELHIPLDNVPDLEDEQHEPLPESRKKFLRTPISVLQDTDNISMVYCPTIHHCRAYLSSLVTRKAEYLNADTTKDTKPYLAIHGILPQHYASTEWSSQGLSRTLSSLTDTASQISHSLLVSIDPDSTIVGIDADLPLINSKMMKNNAKKKTFYGGEGFENDDTENAEKDLRFIGKARDVIERWFRVVDLQRLVEGNVGLNVMAEVESSDVMLV